MKKILIVAVVATMFAAESFAGPFRVFRRTGNTGGGTATNSGGYVNYDGELYSAQGVANRMARLLRIGHFGNPTGGYEGVGSGATPQQAEWNCCFRRQMQPRDIGYAQGANGMWYACCRY